MKNKQSVFGEIGLVAIAIIFLVIVSLSNVLLRGMRADLTENNLFTLSDGTINILGDIQEPLNLYFFFSDQATSDIPQLRTYAGRVRETLQEFSQHADGKLRITVIDPLPFSEQEDRAAQYGLQGISLGVGGDSVYFGIAATNSIGEEEIIPFLDPNKETFLEYDLARLIFTLSNPERPVVGLISGLPMTAEFDPQTRQMRQPWIIISQIQQLFELRSLGTSVRGIAEDIDVLMVVHPKNLTPQTLYAIDQFILAGGHTLLFVDPFSETDLPMPDPTNPAAAAMASRASNLDPLFSTWGISINNDEIIADDRFALAVNGPDQRPVRHLGLIGIPAEKLDQNDVITSGLGNLNLGFSGYISVAEDAAVSVTPLIQSSDLASPVSAAMLGFMNDPESLRNGFSPTGENYTLAARIAGKVSTAFPGGSPDNSSAGEIVSGQAHISDAATPINVVLFADTDLLTDRLWAQVQMLFGQQLVTAFAGNGTLILNAVENMAGSSDLISVRGRDKFTRPFTRVEDLRREAENAFRVTEERLQQELSETEQTLNTLQTSRQDNNTLIITAEQEAELERFQAERLRIRKELRQVQRNLDKDIEALGSMLRVINIGLMPLVVAVTGLGLFFIRQRQRRRKVK